MRCFVAVDLPADARAAVSRLQTALRDAAPRADVRWTAPAAFHLTLQFLGEVPDAQVPAVAAALRAAAADHAPIPLAAAGTGAFPSVRRPRIVWLGIPTGATEVAALARAVQEALRPLAFEPEARPFHAHVTLGRVRQPRALATLTAAVEQVPAPATAWIAGEIVLYRSHLRPGGAIYEPVAHVPLGAGGS